MTSSRHPGAFHDPEGRALPLHRAASLGDLSGLALAINEGVDLDARDVLGRTALWYAVFKDHAHVLRMLLGLHANANLADNEGTTPLHLAVSHARDLQLDLLLSPPVVTTLDLHAVDAKGNTALHRLAMAQALGVRPEPYRVDRMDDWWAKVAQQLLAAGADVLRPNLHQARPIDLVSHTDVVRDWQKATIRAEQAALRETLRESLEPSPSDQASPPRKRL